MRCSSDSTARRGIGLGFGGRRPTDPGKSANQGRTRHLEGATNGCLACSAIKRGSNPFKGLSVDHGRPSTLAPSTLCSRQSRHHPLARQRALILRQRALLQRLAAVRGRLSLCADQAAAAKWWLSMPMASVSAEGPMPKALSTRRTSPLMPGCRHQGRACPLRRARMTSNPLIVA